MHFKHLFGLAVLATVATLALCAPTEKDTVEHIKETTTEVIELASDSRETAASAGISIKQATDGVKDLTVEAKSSTLLDSKELSAGIKETTAEVQKELNNSDMNKVTEKEIDVSTNTVHEEETKLVKDATASGTTAPLDNLKKNELSFEDVIETVRAKEKSLVELEKALREVATVVTETATSSSKPSETDSPNKRVSEIISQFLNELVQIPMVLLHAVSNAITTFTGNRIAVTLNKSPK